MSGGRGRRTFTRRFSSSTERLGNVPNVGFGPKSRILLGPPHVDPEQWQAIKHDWEQEAKICFWCRPTPKKALYMTYDREKQRAFGACSEHKTLLPPMRPIWRGRRP